jgi:hypothetical protein
MQINSLKPQPEKVFFEPNFLVMLESHLSFFRNSGATTLTPISSQQGYKYEGDLYGLLDDLGISKVFHFITARLNGFTSGSDFKGDRDYLLVPSLADIEILKAIYQTKNI